MFLHARKKRLSYKCKWKLEKTSPYVWCVSPAKEIPFGVERYGDDVNGTRGKEDMEVFWTRSCRVIMIRLLDRNEIKPTNDLRL